MLLVFVCVGPSSEAWASYKQRCPWRRVTPPSSATHCQWLLYQVEAGGCVPLLSGWRSYFLNCNDCSPPYCLIKQLLFFFFKKQKLWGAIRYGCQRASGSFKKLSFFFLIFSCILGKVFNLRNILHEVQVFLPLGCLTSHAFYDLLPPILPNKVCHFPYSEFDLLLFYSFLGLTLAVIDWINACDVE